MKTELRSHSEVHALFDPRYAYKNLGKPKPLLASTISKTVTKTLDTLIKSGFYRPEVIVLKNPKAKKLTVTCKFSNDRRTYTMWFMSDPSKDGFDTTKALFNDWFREGKHKSVTIERNKIDHQVDIDPLTRDLLCLFDDHMGDGKSKGSLNVVMSHVDDIEQDVVMHTKYGTTWYVGYNKPIFGRSSFISAGFAYQIK